MGQTHCIDDGSILRGRAQLPPAWSPLRLFPPPPPVDVRYSGHDRPSCLVVGGACMCCQGPQPTDMWEGVGGRGVPTPDILRPSPDGHISRRFLCSVPAQPISLPSSSFLWVDVRRGFQSPLLS